MKRNTEEYNYKAYTALYKAVIMQAILDYVKIPKKERGEIEMYKRQAKRFLNIKNKYFRFVCYNADLDPFWVIKKVKYALENPNIWRSKYSQSLQIFESLD